VTDDGYLRIGELSQRTGVAPALLRAWERRYGLLHPGRSDGGFRLYGDGDVDRVRRAQQLIAGGVSAAEAARLVLADADVEDDLDTPLASTPLLDAVRRLDDVGANAALDRLLARFSTDTVITDVLVPALHEIGELWARGELTVGQEHFASAIVRGRLLALGRGWDQGAGASAVLACPPGERHDIPIVMLGLGLRARGWRVTVLGADTPLESIDDAAARVGADAVVVAALMPGVLDDHADALRMLAARRRLVLAGPGASAAQAAEVGARYLEGDPIVAAGALAALVG